MEWREWFRVVHWGPLLALFIISEITLSGLYCLLQWYPPTTLGGVIHLAVYLQWDIFILYNFFNAMYIGPGHVPSGWTPKRKSDTKLLQYCNQCESYKAPRSHHCRKCGKCVLKMDHHCPWINNCVGHRNHLSFTLFVLFAPLGCLHAACVLVPSLYRAINRHYYIINGIRGVPLVRLTPLSFFACILGVSLAIGVSIAVAILFFVQMKSIIKNETGIETWIKDKAEFRDREESEGEFVYPYDLGRWRNVRMVCHVRRRPELSGLWWPVVDGCDQYTLTREQIAQKREKKERSVEYVIDRAYSGAMCPITMGPKVCCCPPCTDEPRVALSVGDRVIVTRWKKRWLYGDKVLQSFERKDKKRERGWFPRKCAKELFPYDPSQKEQFENSTENHCDSQSNSAHKKTD